MALLMLTLVGVIALQFRTLESVHQQLIDQKKLAAAATEKSQQQQDTIIRRLNCMVAFFL
jgi:hypothetical protein